MAVQSITAAVKWGDFTPNATEYGQRPPYSSVALQVLTQLVTKSFGSVRLAELGAGTGNLLRSFGDLEVRGFAVEPNAAMQAVAHDLAPNESRFDWVTGTAEDSGLADACANWVLLGNAYQFVDPPQMFREAHRILEQDGFLTIIWNVRDFERDALQRDIEQMVKREVGALKRTGSSVEEIMEAMDTGGLFTHHCYVEARHEQRFSPERFLDTWKAGHDVPSQVSEEKWQEIIEKTARMIPPEEVIYTFWRTRAWTLRRAQPFRFSFSSSERTQVFQRPIDLSRAIPPVLPELRHGLMRVASNLSVDVNLADRLRRNRPGGTLEDREAAAGWMVGRLAVRPSTDRVIVANGTQSILGLLLLHCVGSNGILLSEALTYPVLVPLARRYGLAVLPVEIDDCGLVPDALNRACQIPGVRALFCNPTVHNPTTSVLPLDRRQAIVGIARQHGIVIIEDDVLGSLHGTHPPPLAAIGPDVVWYIQSLSKCIALGLKIAFLVGPDARQTAALVDPVSNHSFWFPSGIAAEMATGLITSGRAEAIRDEIRTYARSRLEIAHRILKGVAIKSAPGGLHIWIPLSRGRLSVDVSSAARQVGALVRGSDMFTVPSSESNHGIHQALRVAITTPENEDEFAVGLEQLRCLLAQ